MMIPNPATEKVDGGIELVNVEFGNGVDIRKEPTKDYEDDEDTSSEMESSEEDTTSEDQPEWFTVRDDFASVDLVKLLSENARLKQEVARLRKQAYQGSKRGVACSLM